MSALRLILAALLVAAPVSASASQLDLPLEIDFVFLRQLLLQQVYSSPGETPRSGATRSTAIVSAFPSLVSMAVTVVCGF